MISADVQLLVLISGLVVPILHGLVTHKLAPDWFKSLMTLVLAGLASLISQWIDSQGILSREMLIAWGQVFVQSIAVHYGLFKNLNVTGSEGKLQVWTGGKGLGLIS